MFAWTRRLFATWTDFAEYLVFLGVCLAGVLHASWLWIGIGVMTLFLLTFPAWRHLIAKAGNIDADYRELGRLALVHRIFGTSLAMYSKAHFLAVVLGAKFLQDTLFLTGAYVFGMVIAWFWGVDFGSGDQFSIQG